MKSYRGGGGFKIYTRPPPLCLKNAFWPKSGGMGGGGIITPRILELVNSYANNSLGPLCAALSSPRVLWARQGLELLVIPTREKEKGSAGGGQRPVSSVNPLQIADAKGHASQLCDAAEFAERRHSML